MKLDDIFEAGPKIDNIHGMGAVGISGNIDYMGLRVYVKPSVFLKLAYSHPNLDTTYIQQQLSLGQAIGAPFLSIAIPESWISPDSHYDKVVEGDLTEPAEITGHEGRHRMAAILKEYGDVPVETHLVFNGLRRRHITDNMIERLNRNILNEHGKLLKGPWFSLTETITEADADFIYRNFLKDVSIYGIVEALRKVSIRIDHADKEGQDPELTRAILTDHKELIIKKLLAWMKDAEYKEDIDAVIKAIRYVNLVGINWPEFDVIMRSCKNIANNYSKNLFQLGHHEIDEHVSDNGKIPNYKDDTFEENTATPDAKYLKLADALEDYANKNIPTREQGFGDFMYHAELIRKGHQDVHKQDLDTVQQKYRNAMDDIIKQCLNENFADGKGPGRPGDSRRHGIPKHATLAQLDKIGKGSGRKAQLARWQANMRRGRAKVEEAPQQYKKISPELIKEIVATVPQTREIWFHGSRAIGKHRRDSDWDILVVVPDDIKGNTYIDIIELLRNIERNYPNYDIQPAHPRNMITHIAREEGVQLWAAKPPVTEAIAPHGDPNNELKMMKAGTKPAAIVGPVEFEHMYKPLVNDYGWEVLRLNNKYGLRYVIGQMGEYARVKRIVDLVDTMNKRAIQGVRPTAEYHIQLGRLLGYSEEDIKDFLKKLANHS